jgi:PAS domain S-box-containing protein
MKKTINEYIPGFRVGFKYKRTELEAILELLPQPAILLNTKNQDIIFLNSKAKSLLDKIFGIQSINSLLDIIKDWDIEELVPLRKEYGVIAQSTVTLTNNHGQNFPAQIMYSILPPEGKRGLVLIERLEEKESNNKGSNASSITLSLLTHYLNLLQVDTIQDMVNLVLKIGSELTCADSLAVYLADKNQPSVNRNSSIGSVSWLPETLRAEELIQLRTPFYWQPGKRIHSSIHNNAFKISLNYVATAPLGGANAIIGLVVIAGKKSSVDKDLLEITKDLASLLTILIQEYGRNKHNQELIAEQQFKLHIDKTIMEAVRDGIILLDTDFNIQYINTSAEEMLGYSFTETYNQSVDIILIGSEQIIPKLQQSVNGIKSEELSRIRLYRRSGEAFPALLNLYPLFNEKGKVTLILILISDLSDQEQIQEQAQQLEQQAYLGEVSALFAHEVRNPINNISTGLELMAFNTPDDDYESKELISRLQSDCDRLESLMKSVLNYSKPNEYTMVKVDIELLVTRLLNQFKPRFNRFNITSQLQIDQDLPPILGNYRALEQVLTNIVENAVQAMKSNGGQLSVKLRSSTERSGRKIIQISIADTGAGIPEEEIEHIFEPFFTTKRRGTGLGLAISKRIITAHKGNIDVKSFPGGTIFQVQIPSINGINN